MLVEDIGVGLSMLVDDDYARAVADSTAVDFGLRTPNDVRAYADHPDTGLTLLQRRILHYLADRWAEALEEAAKVGTLDAL